MDEGEELQFRPGSATGNQVIAEELAEVFVP